MPATQDTPGKQKIRRAALELIAAQGHEDVSLRQIAQRAKVSVSLIVHYYRTKRGIVLAVDDALVGDVRACAEGVLATYAHRPVDEAAVSLGDALFQALARPAAVGRYVCRALLGDRQEVHAALKARLVDLVDVLLARLLPAAGSAARGAHAEHLLTMVLGHVMLDGIVPGRSPDVDAARAGCRSGLRTVFRDLTAQAAG